jgi:GR25 family glycosyltransferase involved in LPS biosynthesis
VACEQFVTSSSSEWLLVLEDDALFTKTGSGGLWDILEEADKWDNDAPSFILTSEGLDLGTLRLTDEDFVAVSSQLNATRFPFTNTAAAYLVNRYMATHFVQTLRNKPGLAYNTIDFLINNLMLGLFLRAGRSKISCRHATKPPFQNASLNGGYSSLISS